MRCGWAGGERCLIHGERKVEIMSRSGCSCIDTAASLGAVGLQIHRTPTQHPEALAERWAYLRGQAEAGGYTCVESGARAGRQHTGAGGERRTRWKAPVGALEQDLSPQTAKEVVHKDWTSEKGLGVIDESHLLQRKAQNMSTLLQKRGHLMLENGPTKITALHTCMHELKTTSWMLGWSIVSD